MGALHNTTLYDEFSDIESLEDAWDKLSKSNKLSHGIDNITIDEFSKNIESRIEFISKNLKNKSYQFANTRAAVIPKGNNKFRSLQIPNIDDRVVLKSLAMILEKQFKDILDKCKSVSYAYQKNLSIRDATLKIRERINNENYFVLEVDLVNFFGTVDKRYLLEELVFPKLDDSSLNNIINEALNVECQLDANQKQYHHLFKNISDGIPQGNPLSPLLSNIYLNPFDVEMIKHQINLVRYADDFVILAKSKELANSAFRLSEKILESQLKLSIHKEGEKRYKIIDVRNQNFDFLSVTHSINNFTPSTENIKNLIIKIKHICLQKVNLIDSLRKLRLLIEGWASAFYFTDISQESIMIDGNINHYIFRLFNSLELKLKHFRILNSKEKKKFRLNSNNVISIEQRKNLGIPTIEEFWEMKNKQD